ncbi:MAG: DNA/RNA helicase domain-containing protein [Castellaniella sp.]
MNQPPLVSVDWYPLALSQLDAWQDNVYAANHWPLVYVLSNQASGTAYVGETSDTSTRMATHLKTPAKQGLDTVHLISSGLFNKSATLDIESGLIKYMAADGRFRLLNGNLGLASHHYYQQDELYDGIFRKTWDQLQAAGLAQHSLESIDNSDIFKYSPYKSLSYDQRQGLLAVLQSLLQPGIKTLMVEGGAGTGKTVLAIFLFKLLNSKAEELSLREFSEDELLLRDLVTQFRDRHPALRMALVVPMASFRATLKKAFRQVAGLSPGMVIAPAELARNQYDLVLVDESHRLRRRVNLGAYFGVFDNACRTLGLDPQTCSEVDWVGKQARQAVFFYDQAQSVKPSDAPAAVFERLRTSRDTRNLTLSSQFRVKAGVSYVEFIDRLLSIQLGQSAPYRSPDYEFLLFDSMVDMVREVRVRDQSFGLSRLIAGYAWPWASKKQPDQFDMTLDGVSLRWNRTANDWINTQGAHEDVGCIHTTQGYDLNYAGIIFGPEIRYDPTQRCLTIDRAQYHDRNGQQRAMPDQTIKEYILNIYKTILLRGIRGTFVYACDTGLRQYLRQYIPQYQPAASRVQLRQAPKLLPYENAVPLYDLKAAAGGFGALQAVQDTTWIGVPPSMKAARDLFACQVTGESMNQVIPNGAICLFRLDHGGSRQGRIVLVECDTPEDADLGSRYTVKEYESLKIASAEGWQHTMIRLKPRSDNPEFRTIELSADDGARYRVVGIFVCVLDK